MCKGGGGNDFLVTMRGGKYLLAHLDGVGGNLADLNFVKLLHSPSQPIALKYPCTTAPPPPPLRIVEI
jgi:hypothetical protein